MESGGQYSSRQVEHLGNRYVSKTNTAKTDDASQTTGMYRSMYDARESRLTDCRAAAELRRENGSV